MIKLKNHICRFVGNKFEYASIKYGVGLPLIHHVTISQIPSVRLRGDYYAKREMSVHQATVMKWKLGAPK
jgi:hypothetical protein